MRLLQFSVTENSTFVLITLYQMKDAVSNLLYQEEEKRK